jgi:hypothetical protein
VRGRRGRLPRCEAWRRCETQDNRRARFEHSERDGCGKCSLGRTRFVPGHLCATIVGRGLCDLRSGRAFLMMMKRTRAVPAALHPCFGRRLPAGAEGHCALRKSEDANGGRNSSQNRPHSSRMRCHSQTVK